MKNQTLLPFIAFAVAAGIASSQTVDQPVVLNFDVDNMVYYKGDVNDPNKISRDPGPAVPAPTRAFQVSSGIADLVAVNGRPIKGAFYYSGSVAAYSATIQNGRAIADFDGAGPYINFWEILGPEGAWIGSLMGGGSFPPAPGNMVLGGNGAFLGVTGEIHGNPQQIGPPVRNASAAEDPALRRLNGGGKYRFIVTLYPKFRPSVDMTAAGPAVFHGDFSPVTSAQPARAGELLIVRTRNLGPTRPDLLPQGSHVFKADPLEQVNSPIEITVNGTAVLAINQIGWPGTTDLYRVDFRVPSGLPPGTARIQLTAAWIPGPEVQIPIQ